MRFSAAGLALLKQVEGCRLIAYPDIAGVWTIGYGHTGPGILRGLTWTQAQADQALSDDITAFSQTVAGHITNQALTDNQFSAIVIFAFNIGAGGFATSSALRNINAGNLEAVPAAMMLWDKIHDPHTGQLIVSKGLQNRRAHEIELWQTP